MEENSINLIVKQDHKRTERMRVLMEFLFEKAIHFGEVYLSDNGQSCILLKFPHRERTTIRTIAWEARLAFKCIGIGRVFKVLKRQSISERNYPNEPHIRPLIMGTIDERKGNGTAARMMLKLIHTHKDNHLPVIVDAAADHNVRLYQKFGFKVIGTEEALGFPIWFMRLDIGR
jgi:predicted GNAT family N-acyltransferase